MLSTQLSRQFLVKMSRAYQLSPEQEEVFLLRFGDQKEYPEIAEELKTSQGACLKRMGEVYRKFDLSDKKTRGKEKLLRNLLETEFEAQTQGNSAITTLKMPVSDKSFRIESPGSSVAWDSSFYIERPPNEERCYQEILEPGAIIQIKAPQQMGKTSLLNRILKYAEDQDYQTVNLNLTQVDEEVLGNLEKFLKWFCAIVGRKLELENKIAEYWDDFSGHKLNCEIYFEQYLLAHTDKELVLALDEVDKLFDHEKNANAFFNLLRIFNEKSKQSSIWEKLRLIVVYSTEEYIFMDINTSPLANVGLTVKLPEFTAQQVQDLAKLHRLKWTENQNQALMNLVGGHPYLVRLALYEIASQMITLENLLKTASTDEGIYSKHLQQLMNTLDRYPDLIQSLKKVINTEEPVSLELEQKFKLYSLGLVKLIENDVQISYPLYRDYFLQQRM